MNDSSEQHREYCETQARHVRQCLKEVRLVTAVVVLISLWCCVVCIAHGYVAPDDRPAAPNLVWGIPAWAFWGLIVPWCVSIAVTWGFALLGLKDDEPYMDYPPP